MISLAWVYPDLYLLSFFSLFFFFLFFSFLPFFFFFFFLFFSLGWEGVLFLCLNVIRWGFGFFAFVLFYFIFCPEVKLHGDPNVISEENTRASAEQKITCIRRLTRTRKQKV